MYFYVSSLRASFSDLVGKVGVTLPELGSFHTSELFEVHII